MSNPEMTRTELLAAQAAKARAALPTSGPMAPRIVDLPPLSRADVAAASAANGTRAAEEGLDDAYEPLSGATSETVDILDVAAVRAMVAEHKAGKRAEPMFVVIPKYAPKGTTGWVYTVAAVNRTTVSLTPLGGGRGLKADPFTLAEASAADAAAFEKLRATGAVAAADDGLCTGSIVRLSGAGWKQDPDALWTVTALKGMTEIAVVRLGGDNGRTWPKLPRRLVSAIIAPSGLRDAMMHDPLFRDL